MGGGVNEWRGEWVEARAHKYRSCDLYLCALGGGVSGWRGEGWRDEWVEG